MRSDPNLVFDVGLHMGEDTEFYLKKGFKVVSFEANPDLVNHCKNRFVDQIVRGKLHIIEGAIAPDSYGDHLTFYNSSNSIWGTIEPDWEERNSKLGASSSRIDVKRVDILDVFEKFGVPFYLKIDVEGVDTYVVNKLKELSAVPRYISVESEKVNFSKLTAEMNSLRELGYNKFKIVQQESIPGRTVISKDLYDTAFEHTFSLHASGLFGEEIPQPWLNFDQAIEHYKKIFVYYRLFGDDSVLQHLEIARFVRRIGRLAGRPLPGWYDTHASL